MKRLAGCLVVCLLASAAAWVGCRDDLGEELLPLAVGSATDAAGLGGDAYGGGSAFDALPVTDGSGEGGVPDAGEGGVPDAPPDAGSGVPDAPPDAGSGVPDAGSGVPDAPPDAGSGEGGVPDARPDASGDGAPPDGGDGDGDGDGGDGVADAAGRPDARRGPTLDTIDRTSFYACAGGPASAGLEVGLPIALALGIAVRRRRRWQRTRPPGAP